MCSFRRFGHPLLICARMMFRIVLNKGVETQLPHYLMKEVVGEQGSEVVLLFICVCSSGNWPGRVSTCFNHNLRWFRMSFKVPTWSKIRVQEGRGGKYQLIYTNNIFIIIIIYIEIHIHLWGRCAISFLELGRASNKTIGESSLLLYPMFKAHPNPWFTGEVTILVS